jgi:hypothetical protein
MPLKNYQVLAKNKAILKKNAPYKNALEAIKSPEWNNAHKAIKGIQQENKAKMEGNPKGVMEKNNKTAMAIDAHNRSWNGKKYTK